MSEMTMPGPVARAVARATAAFVNGGHGDPERFEVVVVVGAEDCEVVFVPEPDSGSSIRGGRTSAGPEVHFWVSTATGDVLRSSYAR